MKSNFDKTILEDYLKRLNENYCIFLLHYNIYREFLLSTQFWENQTQEIAAANVAVMNKYVSVFNALDWLTDLSIGELHKIFDKSKPGTDPAISIHLLVAYIKEYQEEINKYSKQKITEEFLDDCDKKIGTISNKLTHLWRSRNNRFHNLQNPKEVRLTFKDIEDISKVVDELFNLIDSTIRWNSWSFDFFHDEPKRDFELLIGDLKKLKNISMAVLNGSRVKTDTELLKEIKGILHFDYL